MSEPITVDELTRTGTDALETLTNVLGDSAEAWRGAYVAMSMTTALLEFVSQEGCPGWMSVSFVHAVGRDFLEVALGYIDTPTVEESFNRIEEISERRRRDHRDQPAASQS